MHRPLETTGTPRAASSFLSGLPTDDRNRPGPGPGGVGAAFGRGPISHCENPLPRSGPQRMDTKSSATFCAMDAHERECEFCRGVRRAADGLRFKRLGSHERRQLLEAAAPGEAPNRIHPPGPSPAEQTATRRAVANLVGIGLLRLSSERIRLLPGRDDHELARLGRKYAVVRQAWRTELGDEIVRRYRAELNGGRRIRWLLHLETATEAALAQCPNRPEDAKRSRQKKPVRLRRVKRGLISDTP